MRLALYEPDIPQNTGALIRLAACFGVAVDLIEPCGFLFEDRRLKRAGLDYAALCRVTRRIAIPLRAPARSLNVALAGAIALTEALRQTNQLPVR